MGRILQTSSTDPYQGAVDAFKTYLTAFYEEQKTKESDRVVELYMETGKSIADIQNIIDDRKAEIARKKNVAEEAIWQVLVT